MGKGPKKKDPTYVERRMAAADRTLERLLGDSCPPPAEPPPPAKDPTAVKKRASRTTGKPASTRRR